MTNVNLGNSARNNAKRAEYRQQLQNTANDVAARKTSGSAAASSITQRSTGNLRNTTNTPSSSGSVSPHSSSSGSVSPRTSTQSTSTVQSNLNVRESSVFGDKGLDAKDFSQMWANTADLENLSEEDKNAIKAQNDILTALVDDGDGIITQEEAQALDLAGNDGVITDEDIQKIYEELGLSTNATIGELLDAVDNILKDGEAKEAEEAKEAAEKGINLDNSGVIEHVDEKTGERTYSVKVETWGSQVDGRPANDCLSRIMTNAYPDMSASERQAIQNQICSMNNISNPNLIYDGADIKLPVVTRDADGNIQFSEKLEPKEETKAEEKKDYSVKHDGGQNGTAVAADGTKVEWNQGRYYVDGKQVEYDEKTGQINGGRYKVEHDGGQNGTAVAADGTKVQWNQGKYYVDGKQVNYNEHTGEITEIKQESKPSTTASTGSTSPSRTTSTGSTSPSRTTSTAPATSTEEAPKASSEYKELVSWVDECNSNNFTKPDIMNKLLEKVDEGGYDLKDFIAEYDKTHDQKFMDAFSDRSFYNGNNPQIMDKFANELIESYGGAESKDLQKYIDNLCNNPNMGGFYYDGAPLLAQQVYQNATDQIIANVNKGAVDSNTSFESFKMNGNYEGLAGWNQAKADYQENVAIMNEFKTLYEKYKDADISQQKVEYETYGQSDGYWSFKTNYDGKNSIEDIYKEMLEDGMAAGTTDWTNFHMSMYKEALAKLQAYDRLMS